jgi:hypothetical protein
MEKVDVADTTNVEVVVISQEVLIFVMTSLFLVAVYPDSKITDGFSATLLSV